MEIPFLADKIEEIADIVAENEFSKKYLVPLFKSLGFEKVDFYGGNYEGGKDIIVWGKDNFDTIYLTVIQVKYYKPTAKAGDAKAFGAVVTQLQQAYEKDVPYTDGRRYSPDKVIMVTPFGIDTRALETRFEAIEGLKKAKIKVIDGTELATLIIKKAPFLMREIVGDQITISDAVIRTLSNVDLRNALNSSTLRDVTGIYCDLDFAVGKITSRFFFALKLEPKNLSITVKLNELAGLVEAVKGCEGAFGVSILEGGVAKIQQQFEKTQKWNDKIEAKLDKLKDKVELLGLRFFIDAIIDSGNDEYDEGVKKIVRRMNEARSTFESMERKPVDSYCKYLSDCSQMVSHLVLLEDEINSKKMLTSIYGYNELKAQYHKLEAEIEIESKKVKPEIISVVIRGDRLAQKLREEQADLTRRFRLIENEGINNFQISSLVDDCFRVLKNSDTILKNKSISEAVGIDPTQVYRDQGTMDRISIPIQKLFNSGRTFVLLVRPQNLWVKERWRMPEPLPVL